MSNVYKHLLQLRENEGGNKQYRVELLLKLLIGVVDTELLKTVDLKCFKSAGRYIEAIRGPSG